jgi:hypothetical protein
MLSAMSGTAWADCTPQKSGFDAYGVAPLGDVSVAFMDAHARREPACDLNGDASCEYRSKDGVWYYFVEGGIEQKEVDLTRLPPGQKAPFGLSTRDTDDDVGRKLKLGGIMTFHFVDSPKPSPWSETTGFCYLNDNGVAFAIEVKFDARGRLASYRTFTESSRD